MAETPLKDPPVEEEAKAAETPVKESPLEGASAAETPVKEPPVEEASAEEIHTEEANTDGLPEEPEKKPSKKRLLLVILFFLAVGIAVVSVYFAFFREKPDDGRIPYEQGVVLLGGETIEPVEQGWLALTYDYKAFSSDGIHFSCFLTNDASNLYDLYFDIYADDTLRDQVFLSGLIPPGYGLKQIELNHALPAGTTKCYVVFNQVDTDEDGNQSMVNQMLVTVDFVVE